MRRCHDDVRQNDIAAADARAPFSPIHGKRARLRRRARRRDVERHSGDDFRHAPARGISAYINISADIEPRHAF